MYPVEYYLGHYYKQFIVWYFPYTVHAFYIYVSKLYEVFFLFNHIGSDIFWLSIYSPYRVDTIWQLSDFFLGSPVTFIVINQRSIYCLSLITIRQLLDWCATPTISKHHLAAAVHRCSPHLLHKCAPHTISPPTGGSCPHTIFLPSGSSCSSVPITPYLQHQDDAGQVCSSGHLSTIRLLLNRCIPHATSLPSCSCWTDVLLPAAEGNHLFEVEIIPICES